MPRRHAYRRIVATLIVPLVVFVGTGSAEALFRCQSDGVIRSACCCPPAPESRESSTEDSLAPACCCDVEMVELAAGDTRGQIERLELSTLRYALVVPVIDFLVPALDDSPVHEVAPDERPPPPTRPILLLKHSLLI